MVKLIDGYIAKNGLDAPQEHLPELRDGFDQAVITELDVRKAGITSVIWAAGYRFDFSWIKLPTFDEDGYPVQQRGVTLTLASTSSACPGCTPGSRACCWAWVRTPIISLSALRKEQADYRLIDRPRQR